MNLQILKSSWSNKILIPTPSPMLLISPTAHGICISSIPSFLCHPHLAPLCCLNALFLSNTTIRAPLFISNPCFFLQTSHFPTISFPFAIADSHFQSQIFSYQTPTGIVSLFSSMLPLGPYNLLSFSLVCTLCFSRTLSDIILGKRAVLPKPEVLASIQQISTEHLICMRHILKDTKKE